jgi:hypothetical protein
MNLEMSEKKALLKKHKNIFGKDHVAQQYSPM